jgi:hypothetical protein
VRLPEDPESEVEWLHLVATATPSYHMLELELPGAAVPAAVVSLADGVLTVALQAEVLPWLPPSLVPLGELDTGLVGPDGQHVAVVLVRLDARAAGLLVPYTGRVSWSTEQRWPAAEGLRVLAQTSPAVYEVSAADLNRDWGYAVPPVPHSVGPAELDHQLGGALSRGPWGSVMEIPWPPREPDGEVTGYEDLAHEPDPYLDDEVEDFADEGFFSALEPAALDDARLAAVLLESQRASAAYPPLPLQAPDGAGAVGGAPGLPLLSGSAAVPTPAATPAAVGRSAQKRAPTPGAGRGRGAGRGTTSGSPGGPPKGVGRGRGLDPPGGFPPKEKTPRASPSLASLAAQLSQVLEGQRTFEARLGRLEAPTRPQAFSGGPMVSVGGGAVPAGGPQLLQSQPPPLVGRHDLLDIAGRPPFLRSSASYDSGQFGLPAPKRAGAGEVVPPPPPRPGSSESIAGPGLARLPSQGTPVTFVPAGGPVEAFGGFAPGLAQQARVGYGRFHGTDPASVSDAQIGSPPGVQAWAQLAVLLPPQPSRPAAPAAAPGGVGVVDPAGPGTGPPQRGHETAPGLAEAEHPFQHLIASQALTNHALHALLTRSGRGADDVLTGLLGSSASDDLAAPKLAGAKGAAAQESLRRDMFEHPRKYIRAIRENAKRELRATPDETDSRCESMYLYLEKHVPFDKARASAYLGFGLATIADYQRRGDLDKAELLTLLLLVALEQSCLDSGRWSLAWLLTHQPEPPWHSIRHAPQQDSLRPFARLADPVWTASAMAYTKDAAALNEIRKKTAGPQDSKPGGKGPAKKEDGKGD